MRFEFATAARIVFGPGSSEQLPAIVKALGNRVLLVTGRNAGRIAPIRTALSTSGVDCVKFVVPGEPTVGLVREGARVCTASERDVVLAIGGGSAIDAAKAIAIVAENSGEPLDFLEVVGSGRPLTQPGLPFIAVPTTAGTGAEVTRNAVLGSPEHALKASLRSPMMLAKAAVVDSSLTLSLPPAETAWTGLDTLTQLLEAFVCRNANPFVDLFCVEGLGRVRDALPRCFADGQDTAARESMSYASLLSGLALSNAGLGVVHGFAGPAGGMLDAPHGAICAALLAEGTRMNVEALQARDPQHPALAKYGQAARILTGQPHADANDLGPWLHEFVSGFEAPGLKALGLTVDQIPELVAKAAKASSMKANPITLSAEELTQVVEQSSN
jgi:alcohol dehydrogenase class IV